MSAESGAAAPARPDVISLLTATVVFVFDEAGTVPLGTGFVVGFPVQPAATPGRGISIPIIVTAKHVLADRRRVAARFNTRDGVTTGLVGYDIEIARSEGDYWEHPDTGVDIAAFRTQHFDSLKYEAIPVDLIATREMFAIHDIKSTDRVIFPSMLVHFMGSKKNYPVLRDGSIAMIPEELVPLQYKVGGRVIDTEQELIFLDATSIPGASGSPVFLWPGPRMQAGSFVIGGGTPYLLGLMHGFYASPPREVIPAEATAAYYAENSRIAIVVPSWKLREILDSDLVKTRMNALIGQTPPPKSVP